MTTALSRRSFLRGLGALAVAPAIVRVESLMPVKSLWPADDYGILQRCMDLGLPFPKRAYAISRPLLINRSGVFDFSGTLIKTTSEYFIEARAPLENTVICNAWVERLT